MRWIKKTKECKRDRKWEQEDKKLYDENSSEGERYFYVRLGCVKRTMG